MDVHPPEHPIHTWRDFLIHLVTITIGLFIALSLESVVEWGHHRELVSQARETLRQEIEGNRKQVDEDLSFVAEDMGRTKANMETLKRLRDHPQGFSGQLHSRYSWGSPNDSAWQTAHESGALSYMPYAEVQRYNDIYKQQEFVTQAAIGIFTQQTHAVAPVIAEGSVAQLTPAETGTVLEQEAEIYTGLSTLGQMAGQLREQYVQVLAKP